MTYCTGFQDASQVLRLAGATEESRAFSVWPTLGLDFNPCERSFLGRHEITGKKQGSMRWPASPAISLGRR